jgi:hypothetical protein
MIKKLFFVAALLMPSLACGGDPTANLPVQIIPAGSDPAVPAPAAAAGFTTLALDADFTSPAYSNPATWLAECGASPGAQNTIWHLIFNEQEHAAVAGAPCDRAIITTDGGSQVLDVQWRPSDFSCCSYTLISLDWPAGEWGEGPSGPGGAAGGPNGTGLPQQGYVELTFRIPAAGFGGFTRDSLPFDWWQDQCNGCAIPASHAPEVDFFEIHSSSFDGTSAQLLQGNPGFQTNAYNLSVTQYHTLGVLMTNNGVDTTSTCSYLDGSSTPVNNTCVQFSRAPTGLGEFYKNIAMWVGADDCFGHPGCETQNADVLIKRIRIFECANYWNNPCLGPLITR